MKPIRNWSGELLGKKSLLPLNMYEYEPEDPMIKAALLECKQEADGAQGKTYFLRICGNWFDGRQKQLSRLKKVMQIQKQLNNWSKKYGFVCTLSMCVGVVLKGLGCVFWGYAFGQEHKMQMFSLEMFSLEAMVLGWIMLWGGMGIVASVFMLLYAVADRCVSKALIWQIDQEYAYLGQYYEYIEECIQTLVWNASDQDDVVKTKTNGIEKKDPRSAKVIQCLYDSSINSIWYTSGSAQWSVSKSVSKWCWLLNHNGGWLRSFRTGRSVLSWQKEQEQWRQCWSKAQEKQKSIQEQRALEERCPLSESSPWYGPNHKADQSEPIKNKKRHRIGGRL